MTTATAAADRGEWTVRLMTDGRVMLGGDRVLGTIIGGGRHCQAKPAVAALGGGGLYAYRIDAIRGLAHLIHATKRPSRQGA